MAGPDRSRIGFLTGSQALCAPELFSGKASCTKARQDPSYLEEATCVSWRCRREAQPLSQVDCTLDGLQEGVLPLGWEGKQN